MQNQVKMNPEQTPQFIISSSSASGVVNLADLISTTAKSTSGEAGAEAEAAWTALAFVLL